MVPLHVQPLVGAQAMRTSWPGCSKTLCAGAGGAGPSCRHLALSNMGSQAFFCHGEPSCPAQPAKHALICQLQMSDNGPSGTRLPEGSQQSM